MLVSAFNSGSGSNAGLIWPVPSSRMAASLSVSVQRSHSRPLHSRPSNPHRSQKKLRVMPGAVPADRCPLGAAGWPADGAGQRPGGGVLVDPS
jgi:hypothetical protein